MDLISRLTNELYREPRRGRVSLLPIGFGLVVVIFGGISIILDEPLNAFPRLNVEFVIMGIAFLCMGTAEVVPVERRQLSGLLRISAVCACVLFGGIAVMPELFGTRGESLEVLIVYTALFFVVVTLIWIAGTHLSTGGER